jgi:hypothetical protein
MNHGGHLNVAGGVKIYCNACADLTSCQYDWPVSCDEKSRRSSSWTRSHGCLWDCDACKRIIRENGFYFWTSLDGLVESQESAKTAAVIS